MYTLLLILVILIIVIKLHHDSEKDINKHQETPPQINNVEVPQISNDKTIDELFSDDDEFLTSARNYDRYADSRCDYDGDDILLRKQKETSDNALESQLRIARNRPETFRPIFEEEFDKYENKQIWWENDENILMEKDGIIYN